MNDAGNAGHWLEYEVIEKGVTFSCGETTEQLFSAKLKLTERPSDLLTDPERETMEWIGKTQDVGLTITPHAEISKLVMYAFPISEELPVLYVAKFAEEEFRNVLVAALSVTANEMRLRINLTKQQCYEIADATTGYSYHITKWSLLFGEPLNRKYFPKQEK